MKMPLGTELDLRAGHIVLDRFPALRERRTVSPSFRPMSIVATVAHLSYCWALVTTSVSVCVCVQKWHLQYNLRYKTSDNSEMKQS